MNGLKPRIYFSTEKQNLTKTRNEDSNLKTNSGFERKAEFQGPEGWGDSHCFYYLAFKKKHLIPM